MAMTDIAEDDLDEMMREEAEDVFYEDGRLAEGSVGRCESMRGFTGGLLEDHSEVTMAGLCLAVVIRVKKRVKAKGWPRGISSAA